MNILWLFVRIRPQKYMFQSCVTFQAIELEELYVEYCKSRPTADEILNRPEAIDYWEVAILISVNKQNIFYVEEISKPR